MSIPIHETEITIIYFVHKKSFLFFTFLAFISISNRRFCGIKFASVFLSARYVWVLIWILKIPSFPLTEETWRPYFDFEKGWKIWCNVEFDNFPIPYYFRGKTRTRTPFLKLTRTSFVSVPHFWKITRLRYVPVLYFQKQPVPVPFLY